MKNNKKLTTVLEIIPLLTLFIIQTLITSQLIAQEKQLAEVAETMVEVEMILIEGGSFTMGDIFKEGNQNEQPLHRVTLDNFFLSAYEVTIHEFKTFINETGYVTSAEGILNPDAQNTIMKRIISGEASREEIRELHEQILQYSGAGYWDIEERRWNGYEPHTNWKNPGIVQTEDNPVMAISWDDAIHFCNWLSKKNGLPVSYDLENGNLLTKDRKFTTDLSQVKGYRLPTEAEWEYAAREYGKKVRFGNGKNVARSSEINFMGDEGVYPYLELSGYAKHTMPVGSYPSNSLGLFDMSGNAWEWVSDVYSKYDSTDQKNPYITAGTQRILRGGRWGGNASEIRASHRTSWPRNDRCNNSGFRLARSVK